MKITQSHFDQLERLANCVLNNISSKEFASIRFTTDQSRAQRFYVLFMIRERLKSRLVSDELYNYLNDDHIDTAMKKIMG